MLLEKLLAQKMSRIALFLSKCYKINLIEVRLKLNDFRKIGELGCPQFEMHFYPKIE